MQETRNNCLGSKMGSTTLRQAKTSKHEFRKVTATYNFSALLLIRFRLTKGCAAFFRFQTIVASFLHLMVLSFKVIFNHCKYTHHECNSRNHYFNYFQPMLYHREDGEMNFLRYFLNFRV